MNKTEFKGNYNVVKILTDKAEIMKQLETFNKNNQAVAFGARKQHKLTIDEKFELIMVEIKEIKNRLTNVENRLDRNNIN